MSISNEQDEEETLLPHHEQQPLCTTRLPYRQGRKLTAVKVYTINNESVHLLIFGVPSLNIRQEAKALFSKFGKVLQFNLTNKYTNERFTETYHVLFERIQSARIAKKMLDGNNFYGGSLHICYAPELETVQELRNKLMQRKKDIMFRLNRKEDTEQRNSFPKFETHIALTECFGVNKDIETEVIVDKEIKLNMGEENTIYIGQRKRRRNKMCSTEKKKKQSTDHNIDIVDCTNIDNETITNLSVDLIEDCSEKCIEKNEMLNYNNFGNEIIKKIPEKPLNKIKFHFNNKKLS